MFPDTRVPSSHPVLLQFPAFLSYNVNTKVFVAYTTRRIAMLTKSEYKILSKIEKLPGKCIRANALPEDISIQDISRMLALNYLVRGTLVPPDK